MPTHSQLPPILLSPFPKSSFSTSISFFGDLLNNVLLNYLSYLFNLRCKYSYFTERVYTQLLIPDLCTVRVFVTSTSPGFPLSSALSGLLE